MADILKAIDEAPRKPCPCTLGPKPGTLVIKYEDGSIETSSCHFCLGSLEIPEYDRAYDRFKNLTDKRQSKSQSKSSGT